VDLGSRVAIPRRSDDHDGCSGLVSIESETICSVARSTREAASAVGEAEGEGDLLDTLCAKDGNTPGLDFDAQ
jgi:hypothetical protein